MRIEYDYCALSAVFGRHCVLKDTRYRVLQNVTKYYFSFLLGLSSWHIVTEIAGAVIGVIEMS